MSDNLIKIILAAVGAESVSSHLKGVKGALDQVGDSWNKVANFAIAGISVAAITQLVTSTVAAKDALVETAEKIGIASTSLQVYEHAAKVCGTEQGALTSGLGLLQKNMLEAARGNDKAAQGFATLGVNIRDSHGNLKSVDAMLPELADKFAGMTDGTAKTGIAMELLGKSGKEMVPILNLGSAGLAGMKTELEGLGVKLDEAANQRMANFNDDIDRMKTKVGEAGVSIVSGMIPALESLMSAFLNTGSSGGALVAVGSALGETLRAVAAAGVVVVGAFDMIGTVIGEKIAQGVAKVSNLISGVGTMLSGGGIKAGWDQLNADTTIGLTDMGAKFDKYKGMIVGFWTDVDKQADTRKASGKTIVPEIINEKQKKDLADTKDKVAALYAEFGKWNSAIAETNPLLTEQDKAMNKLNDEADKFRKGGIPQEQIDIALATAETNLRYKEQEEAVIKAANEASKAFAQELKDFEKKEDDKRAAYEKAANLMTGIETSRLTDYEQKMKGYEKAETDSLKIITDKWLASSQEGGDWDVYLSERNRINDYYSGVRQTAEFNESFANQEQWDADTAAFEQDMKDRLLKSDDFFGGMKLAYDDLSLTQITWAQTGVDLVHSFSDQSANTFSSVFVDAYHGKLKDASDYWTAFCDGMVASFADSLGKMASQDIIGMITGKGGGGSGGLFDTLVSIGSSALDLGGDFVEFVSSLFHEGGVVGVDGQSTSRVSPLAFIGARRFHNGGLASDEIPAILQEGEVVIPKDAVAAGTGLGALLGLGYIPAIAGAAAVLGGLGADAMMAGTAASVIAEAIPSDITGSFQPWQADLAVLSTVLGGISLGISGAGIVGGVLGLGNLGAGTGFGKAIGWVAKGINAILDYMGYSPTQAEQTMWQSTDPAKYAQLYAGDYTVPPSDYTGDTFGPGSTMGSTWGAGWAGISGTGYYAAGTDYVPNTGLAWVHKGEAIIPAKDHGSLASEMRRLRVNVTAAMVAMNKNSAKTAKILDRWEGAGMPPART
jgi:hypothetical protein